MRLVICLPRAGPAGSRWGRGRTSWPAASDRPAGRKSRGRRRSSEALAPDAPDAPRARGTRCSGP